MITAFCILLLIFVFKLTSFSLKAAWGITKFLFGVVLFPVIMIGLVIAGFLTLALPILAIVVLAVVVIPFIRGFFSRL